MRRIVLLAGGVGGAKLAHGLAQVLSPEQLSVIVNTGDDFWHYGLRICPDLDTVMYTLSGLVDPVNGWGVAGDTVAMLSALQRYGEETWFRLGDQDVATHLLRTQALRGGSRLTEVTARFSKTLGVACQIMPMTDDEVSTIIDTVEYGELAFQEYFVRYRWQPTVKAIRFDGIETARPTPEVEAAIAEADAIVFGPSNPWLSIAPILAVPGLRTLIEAQLVPRIALSPIVAGRALKGPAAKLMAELGWDVSASAVARYYGDLINGFVYDVRDAGADVKTKNAVTFDTIMKTDADRAALASAMLEWIKSGVVV